MEIINFYRKCCYLATCIFILFLFPFIEHPVVFGTTFFLVFHDRWDQKILEIIKDHIDFDNWF